MHNVLVCDDSVPFLEKIVSLLENYVDLYNISVISFDNGKDLLKFCQSNKFDIIYMDIEIGKENGMSLAKILKKLNPKSLTIYVSAYDNYYVDMVQAEPFQFIRKDYVCDFEKQIEMTLKEAIYRLNHKDIWSFSFGRNKYSIDLELIQYFYSTTRMIRIVGNTEGAPDYFYGKIDYLEKEIERINNNFIRINKSCIINIKYVKRFSKDKVEIDNKVFSVTKKYGEKFIRTNWDNVMDE